MGSQEPLERVEKKIDSSQTNFPPFGLDRRTGPFLGGAQAKRKLLTQGKTKNRNSPLGLDQRFGGLTGAFRDDWIGAQGRFGAHTSLWRDEKKNDSRKREVKDT